MELYCFAQHRNDLNNYPCPQYSYLLTSQLESQRIYWENKIAHLEKEVAEEVGSNAGVYSVALLSQHSTCVFLLTLSLQVNNMKAKFKETLERCDNLEQRVSEISKDKQSLEKK